jgi:hypothetical protein
VAGTEQLEMDAHRAQLTADVRKLVAKYQSIFGWDVPDVDEALSDRLILGALRRAIDDVEAAPRAGRPR